MLRDAKLSPCFTIAALSFPLSSAPVKKAESIGNRYVAVCSTNGYGSLVFKSNVWSSITSTPVKRLKIALKSSLAFRRLNVQRTSAAVKSFPEWNLTPSRNLKRVVVASICSQLSAKRGSNANSWFQRTSGSYTMCDNCSVPPESCSCGSNETGSASYAILIDSALTLAVNASVTAQAETNLLNIFMCFLPNIIGTAYL